MPRRLAWLPVLALLALFSPSARGVQPTESSSAAALLGPAVSGELAYVRGAAVWTDYAYDDQGAGYGDGQSNTADLIQLRHTLGRGGLTVEALLETLDPAHVPTLGLALDTDADAATGAAALPGAWRPQQPLGVDVLLTVDATGAQLWRATGASWAVTERLPAQVDAGRRTMAATIPARVLPRDRTVRAFGVLGHGWLAGSPLTDLAFVGDEPFANFQHARSDEILAGTRPAPPGLLDLRAMRRGTTAAAPLSPGLHTLLYRSDLELGGGVRPFRDAPFDSVGGSVYLGPYQPYLLYVPERLATPAALVLFLHGHGSTFLEDAPFFRPGGFQPPAVVAFPFGRGEGTYYAGIGEQDVYDVQADVTRRFRVDPDRVVLSGISMGGMGTFRLAQLHPDRWSALAPIINMSSLPLPEEQAAVGRRITPAQLENVTNLPIRMINGRLDPLANVNPDKDIATLLGLGVDLRSVELVKRQHEVVPQLQACLLLDALSHRRVDNPASVNFSTQPAMESDSVTQGARQTYDSAWWLSEVRHRGALAFDDKATVSVTSLARSDRGTTRAPIVAAGQNLSGPGDPCGTPGSTAQTQDAWTVVGQAVTAGPAQPTSNAFHMTMARAGSVTLDLPRMSLSTTAPVTGTILGDGTSALGLRGEWSRTPRVTLDGAPVAARLVGGVLRFTVDLTGRRTLVVAP